MTRLILYNIEYLEGLTGKKSSYLKFWRRFSHPKNIESKIAEELKRLLEKRDHILSSNLPQQIKGHMGCLFEEMGQAVEEYEGSQRQ